MEIMCNRPNLHDTTFCCSLSDRR
uniref:Uncharacterized protein n=1 Tax=Rhizophora mucronata TaxID=61149 RepID=A0A2P2QZQ6_RHIMU